MMDKEKVSLIFTRIDILNDFVDTTKKARQKDLEKLSQWKGETVARLKGEVEAFEMIQGFLDGIMELKDDI